MSQNYKTRNNGFGVDIQNVINSSINAGIDSSKVTVNGQELDIVITGIVNEINADNLAMQNIPTLTANNQFSGVNNFTGITSAQIPSSDNDLANKIYVDTRDTFVISNLKSSANTWTNTNTFNSNLPTSTITNLTNSTQLTPKLYVDSKVGSIFPNTNNFTAVQNFNNGLTIKDLSSTNTIFNFDVSGNPQFRGLRINDPSNNQCFTFNNSNNPVFTKDLTCTNSVAAGQFYSPNLPLIETDKSSSASNNSLIQKVYVDTAFNNLRNNPLNIQTSSGQTSTETLRLNDASGNVLGFVLNNTVGGYNSLINGGDATIYGRPNLNLTVWGDANTPASGVKINRNNVLIQNGTQTINVDGSGNTITFSSIPVLGSDLSYNSDLQLVNKKYVDNKTSNIASTSGNNIFSGVSTFSQIPVLGSDLNYNSDLQLINKKYVDTKINRCSYTLSTERFTTLDTTYSNGFRAPNLIDGSPIVVYLNAPSNTNYFAPKSVYIKFFYYYQRANVMYSVTLNGVPTTYNYDPAQPTSTSSPASNMIKMHTSLTQITDPGSTYLMNNRTDNTFYLSLFNTSNISTVGILSVSQVQSTRSIWTNQTSSTALGGPIQTAMANAYGNTNPTTTNYIPVNFEFVNLNKIKITVRFPPQTNSPLVAGWISSCGFNIDVSSGYNTNGNNDGWYFTNT